MNKIINKINYIIGKIEIKKEDIGKEIQLLNNKGENDDKIQNNEIEEKIKIIINGEIKSNILKYKFNEDGLKTIYLFSEEPPTNISNMFYEC